MNEVCNLKLVHANDILESVFIEVVFAFMRYDVDRKSQCPSHTADKTSC